MIVNENVRKIIANILERFLYYNANWIITGVGSMKHDSYSNGDIGNCKEQLEQIKSQLFLERTLKEYFRDRYEALIIKHGKK